MSMFQLLAKWMEVASVIWRGAYDELHLSIVFSKRANTRHHMFFLFSRHHGHLRREWKRSCLRDGTECIKKRLL